MSAMDPVILTISSVFAVSLVSLVGIAAFSLEEKTLRKALFALVGLAAGALIGDAIIHLIPESLEVIGDERLFGLAVIGGLLVFFFLEKGLRWHHAHHGHEHEHTGHEQYERGTHGHLAPMVIVADGVHNAIDGAVIAASFLVSPALGATTTLAVFLHEIPQEIADYALLLHSGLSRGMALFYNFLSGAMAFLGAGLVLWIGSSNELVGAYAAAATAGAFIYLAATDLIPEINKARPTRRSVIEVSAFLIGIGLMVGLSFLE
ncbi:MAG: ZIP family metal transporter [Candidatus Pacebacteria bacterium]|nr:ZIP family metal transporter [Candidatus Paceibacterota bacterium]